MHRAQRTAPRFAFTESLRNRTVLVTGHTGFKGSWLSLWLHELGARVVGYALDPPTQPNNFEASGIHALLARDYRADIRDMDTVLEVLDESQPDVVFHLAAQTVVRESFVNRLAEIAAYTLAVEPRSVHDVALGAGAR